MVLGSFIIAIRATMISLYRDKYLQFHENKLYQHPNLPRYRLYYVTIRLRVPITAENQVNLQNNRCKTNKMSYNVLIFSERIFSSTKYSVVGAHTGSFFAPG
jgi:hypothetical protein